MPTEYLPTAAALTMDANSVKVDFPTPEPTTAQRQTAVKPTLTKTLTPVATAIGTATDTPTTTDTAIPTSPPMLTAILIPPGATVTTLPVTLTLLPTPTSHPEVPPARIQIYRLGELSLVTSPIKFTSRITSQTGKVVRVELYGEDGRLLTRQVKVYQDLPWHVATINMELDFEITAAAEIGRLVISVEDIHGRVMDLNSVHLVLLSSGVTELNPASAIWQAIVIQEPTPKALIQGGVVLVSGLARPHDEHPLRVALVEEDGHMLGQRLAGVSDIVPGGYGTFFAEVPYDVSDVTPVLLTVYEDGMHVSDMIHLSSIEVLLSP